ncbi:hypothetical protein I7648_07240 [Collinsella tanakaei]|nr:hypothetical protein [Collinsella tanakaei]
MALIQVAMEVPDDIALLIDAGELIRRGGVVRDASGHIVKHLKEVDLPDAAEGAEMAQKALAMANQYKYPLIGIGIAAVAAIGGVVAYKLTTKQKNDADKKLSEDAVAFNEAMTRYLDSIKAGDLNEGDLEGIIRQVDGLREGLDGKTVTLDLDGGQLETLVDMLRTYTEKLAAANGASLREAPSVEDAGEYGNVILLRHYLGEQQRILQAA